MAIISVERYDPKTREIEDYLINTDFIVFAKDIGTHKTFGTMCGVYLSSEDAFVLLGSLDHLEERIHWAGQYDAKPKSLQGNPWGQK